MLLPDRQQNGGTNEKEYVKQGKGNVSSGDDGMHAAHHRECKQQCRICND